MMTSVERLTHMANQIARNLSAQGFEAAARTTADHISAFWAPQMRAILLSVPEAALEPIAVEAVQIMRREHAGAHPPQTQAKGQGSDAG